MSMVEGIYAGCIGISQEWLSLLGACGSDMMLTVGSTDRLIKTLFGGRMILVELCKQSCTTVYV